MSELSDAVAALSKSLPDAFTRADAEIADLKQQVAAAAADSADMAAAVEEIKALTAQSDQFHQVTPPSNSQSQPAP